MADLPTRSASGDTGALPPVAAAAVAASVVAAAALAGRRNAPDESHPKIDHWYHSLAKPPFTPPDPVFGAVWPVVEMALALGGYRLLRQSSSPARNAALGLWLLNTGMIGGWPELFFRKHELGASATAAGAMTATGAAYVATAAQVDRGAALAGVPYTAWVAFATALAEEVWWRNPPHGSDASPSQAGP